MWQFLVFPIYHASCINIINKIHSGIFHVLPVFSFCNSFSSFFTSLSTSAFLHLNIVLLFLCCLYTRAFFPREDSSLCKTVNSRILESVFPGLFQLVISVISAVSYSEKKTHLEDVMMACDPISE